MRNGGELTPKGLLFQAPRGATNLTPWITTRSLNRNLDQEKSPLTHGQEAAKSKTDNRPKCGSNAQSSEPKSDALPFGHWALSF